MLAKVRKYKSTKISFLSASKIKSSLKQYKYIKQITRESAKYQGTKILFLNGCNATPMNIQKRLKHTDGRGGSRKRKEYGANPSFRKNQNFQKTKNRKNQKLSFSSCVRVRERRKQGYISRYVTL